MLSGHHYWNFEAYQETQDLVGHVMEIPSSRFVATDGILIPTGDLDPTEGTPLDFKKAKSVGGSINATAEGQFCGTGCVGFDNCWIYDHNTGVKPTFSVWSVNSGIKLDVTTNQPALQVCQ
jgi:galactose mutarotase-like enzyme